MRQTIDSHQVARLRLQTHRLAGPRHLSPASVVQSLLCVQAQDFPAGQFALGVRTSTSTAADVRAALDSAAVVRSWPMRGTLHLVAAEDLQWILELTAERTIKSAARRREELGIDAALIDRARAVTNGLLHGNGRATRSEFTEALEAGGVAMDAHRSYHIIWFLAHEGVICWGPMSGDEQQLVLVDEWLPKQNLITRDDALARFAYRYFDGHGPATLKDFAWWNKLPMTDARAGMAAVRDRLVELQCGDLTYWMTTEGLRRSDPDATEAAESVLALPGFDEYLLGYQNRADVLAPEVAARVVPGNNGIFLAMIVVGGQIVGTWRRLRRAKHVEVVAVPFGDFSTRERQGFEAAIDRYSSFMGAENKVTYKAP